MLDRQIDDFTARDRLGFMLLGLLSTADRVAALAALPREDGLAAEPSALSDAVLGLISLRRSLRALLCADAGAIPPPEPPAHETGAQPSRRSWLR